jgi:hypothetical protein
MQLRLYAQPKDLPTELELKGLADQVERRSAEIAPLSAFAAMPN